MSMIAIVAVVAIVALVIGLGWNAKNMAGDAKSPISSAGGMYARPIYDPCYAVDVDGHCYGAYVQYTDADAHTTTLYKPVGDLNKATVTDGQPPMPPDMRE